jgi:Phage tail sheath C-terminal domain/Flagellin hook IN motif
MAYPLNSPGVDVSVTDESFYATAGEGTVPLIIIGTHEYKTHPNGTDISEGTLPENANKLYLITSQRELVQTFGNPIFYQKNGTSRHGFELNEYGLHAAYSYLGIANKAFVVRGSLDYSQLFPRTSEPVGEPFAGTYWLDTSNSVWGIHEGINSTSPGSAWAPPSTVLTIDDPNLIEFRMIGSVSYASATDQVINTAGNLVLNGVTIALAGGDTLQAIATKINTAAITGLTANVFQLAGLSRLIVRYTVTNGTVSVGASSDPTILGALGFAGSQETSYGPRSSIGLDGNYAMVIGEHNDNEVFVKLRAGGIETSNDPLSISFWYKVGTPNWKLANPTRAAGNNLGNGVIAALNNKVLTLNTSNTVAAAIDVTFGTGLTVADAADAINTALTALVGDTDKGDVASALVAFAQNGSLVLVNKLGGDIVLDSDSDAAVILGIETKFGVKLTYSPHYTIPSRTDDLGRKRVSAGDVWMNTTQYNNGANWTVKVFNGDTGLWVQVVAPLLVNDATANSVFTASKGVGTLYVRYNISGTIDAPVADHDIRRWNGTAWESLVYNYGSNAPTTDAEEGTLWFNDDFKVDVMINDGDQWVGYRNYPGNALTSVNGVILSGSTPTLQQNGQPLQQNDLWINTSDTENYPKMYRYQATARSWQAIDVTDATTPNGIVFADARETATGLRSGPTDMASMLASNYLDPDAPDPRVYPEGTLLFNTRYSTNVVKEWRPNYFAGEYESTNYTLADYNVGFSTFDPIVDVGRWVSVSGSQTNGTPNMGRKAQRAMVVRALQNTINSNEDIRAESIYFNLIAAPGYVELIDEMVTLNTDKKEIALIVGDTPIRLDSSATSIQKFAQVALSGVASNSEDGVTTFNPYVAMYYPWGLGSNVDGFDVMIPPSAMALRTIAYSDSVSYPWYAPAGTTRGMVTNATNVGYLTSEGEFRSVLLNEGQRDTLYTNNINPIAYLPNRGLVVYGQKTRNSSASALDRINVARLINYMRYNLDNLSRPFLFEPHTFHTRDSIRIAFERSLASLVNLNAMYDFIVVCDETNNTPDRIDRNELWVDVAIQPVKAIEFIYIPIRIVNTGDDLSELYATSTTL